MKNSQDSANARQSNAYTATRKREVNLRRNPTLHFQIGLILALLASIFFIEMRMPEKAMVTHTIEEGVEPVFTLDNFVVEKPVVKKPKVKQETPPEQPKFLEKDPIVTDKPEIIEAILDPTEATKEPMVNPEDVDYNNTVDELPIEPTIFNLVEEVPLFPGCEGLSNNAERRDCMSSKISKFVSKKFRTKKGEGLGLEGKNRIFATFKIDQNGNVTDIKARAPHKNLENEAKRVIELLPEMTPGKQQGVNVPVLFSLPISFEIQD